VVNPAQKNITQKFNNINQDSIAMLISVKSCHFKIKFLSWYLPVEKWKFDLFQCFLEMFFSSKSVQVLRKKLRWKKLQRK
jgi:hypothetical protein